MWQLSVPPAGDWLCSEWSSSVAESFAGCIMHLARGVGGRGRHGAPQSVRIDVGNPVQHVRGVDQLLEPVLGDISVSGCDNIPWHRYRGCRVGLMLQTRLNPPDLEGAHYWYERADAGSTEAMTDLGLMLETGVNPPDLEGARYWYERALNAGDIRGGFRLDDMLATDSQDRVRRHRRRIIGDDDIIQAA